MRIIYSDYQIIETPRQKLFSNRTVQWFLFGRPDYFDNLTMKFMEKMQEEHEKRLTNAIIYGTSHPEMYMQEGDQDTNP